MVVVVDEVVVVVDVGFALFIDVITHRNPLEDFLHWYLTFLAVRKEPAFTHLVPTTCGAALETDETLKSVKDKQIPRTTPMCFFTNVLCDPFKRFQNSFAYESFVAYFSFGTNFQAFCSNNSF